MLTDEFLENLRVKAEMDSKTMGHQPTFPPGIVLELIEALIRGRQERRFAKDHCQDILDYFDAT